MTPEQEHALYLRDRRAWAQRVAPRRAQRMATASPEEKRRLWDSSGPELRAALWELKKRSGE